MSPKNKLVITTPSDCEIALTRDFDAPRALVWEMFTKPEHVKQWWGCKMQENLTIEIDLRVGGTWRFIGRTPDGTLVPFRGEYREIVRPERIVYTEIFDVPMAKDHPALVTATFDENAGKTILRCLVRHDSKQSRDAHLSSGMERGAASSYDEIERMLASHM